MRLALVQSKAQSIPLQNGKTYKIYIAGEKTSFLDRIDSYDIALYLQSLVTMDSMTSFVFGEACL